MHTIALRPKNIDSLFLYYNNFTDSFRKFASVRCIGTKVSGISFSELCDYNLNHPINKEEQEKIGELFETLDKLIEDQEKLVEVKKDLKKSLFQKLFPKEGEDEPQIRFPGFKGKWENTKLSDISDIVKGDQLKKDQVSAKGKYYHLNGGIYPSNRTNLWNTQENTISISEGGNSCGYINYNSEKFFSGGHNYTLQNVKTDNYFMFSVLKSRQNHIMRLRVGSGLPNIQKKDICHYKIKLPSLEEQEQIGSFFQSLDEEITSEEDKLIGYTNLKKALLQKMFV